MTPEVHDIDVLEAVTRAADGSALLLDVREDDEWAAGHAQQSVHVALSRLHPDAVPTDRPVLVVCRSGNRSRTAAAALLSVGYDAVNVAGGLRAWSAAGLPLVRADGTPGEVL